MENRSQMRYFWQCTQNQIDVFESPKHFPAGKIYIACHQNTRNRCNLESSDKITDFR